jgi:hypothetical protein
MASFSAGQSSELGMDNNNKVRVLCVLPTAQLKIYQCVYIYVFAPALVCIYMRVAAHNVCSVAMFSQSTSSFRSGQQFFSRWCARFYSLTRYVCSNLSMVRRRVFICGVEGLIDRRYPAPRFWGA